MAPPSRCGGTLPHPGKSVTWLRPRTRPPQGRRLAEELAGLRTIEVDARTFARALEVQGRLARVGGLRHRSVKIADLVIAAAAEAGGATALHYDSDFDRIARVTGQPVTRRRRPARSRTRL